MDIVKVDRRAELKAVLMDDKMVVLMAARSAVKLVASWVDQSDLNTVEEKVEQMVDSTVPM